MKLQHMIIIFLIIMLPLALIMSQYTGLQIDTLSMKTKYDTILLSSTFDTMAAFELNTINNSASSVVGEEIRDLEAVISTFATSLASSLGISSASSDDVLTYVPAIVFGLYDGYYIYAQNDTATGRELKPYVYYTKTYSRNNTDITIAFSLDNYVSIYGTYKGKSISASGYLVNPDDVRISNDFAYVITSDEKRGTITKVIDPGTESGGQKSWIKYKRDDVWYDIGPETIYENQTFSTTDEIVVNSPKDTTAAMMYYYEAKQFTELYNDVVGTLGIADMNALYISADNDPEDENSLFMNEKINVMKNSITKNLNNAIYNYEGAIAINYEMPQLTGEDWEKILNNISITAFLKDIPVGATRYNNYVVVNSTTNLKYSSAKAIDFVEYVDNGSNGVNSYGYYHKITCDELIDDIESGIIDEIVGYASVDFEKYKYAPEGSTEYYYYYKHNEYADYVCEVESMENKNVATIEKYIKGKTTDVNVRNKILKAYYTAVGRIRYGLVKASSYINLDTNKSFTVRYYPNGGNWSQGNPQIVNTDIGKLQVISESPSIAGKTFMGWSRRSNATEAEVKVGDSIYGQEGRTIDLYAVYANQYTVTYYTNGGQGGPTPNVQTKISGQDYTIPSARPTRENYVFLGWSTNPAATTPEYVAGDIYSEDRNLNLYAVWASEMVRITYNTKGGSIVPSQEKAIGATIKLEGTPVLVGATFRGWSTTQNGTIPEYMPGSDYSENVNRTLYAIWETTTFRITYNANGGELPSDLQNTSKCTKNYGLGYKILGEESKPTRNGYTFIGWSKDPNALVGDINYAPGSIYTLNADLNLYAVWEGEQYTIVYDANGGTNAPGTQTSNKGENLTISNTIPNREGYEFLGWSTNPSALEDEVQYRPGQNYTAKTSAILYAVWKQGTYTIEYNATGGNPTPANQTKKYGENINITSTQPSKADYYFIGWSEDINSKTVDYYPNQVYRENRSITLYAIWSTGYYDIIYDANGGTGEPESDYEIPTGTVTTISTIRPTKDGYTFIGWSTDRNATTADNRYAPGSAYSGPSTLKLYAVWSASSHTLTVNPNGGTWKNSSGTTVLPVTTNDVLILEAPIAPQGYSFSDWSIVAGDAIISYIDDGNYQIKIKLLNSTVIANYRRNYYMITYDANTTAIVTNMPENSVIQYGTTATVSSLVPRRDGYTFLGWSTNRLASTSDSNYTPGTTFTMPANNITLYAVWTTHVHTDDCYHKHVEDCYSRGQYTASNGPSRLRCEVCEGSYQDHYWACRQCSWTGHSRTSYCTCGQHPYISITEHIHKDTLICKKTESTLECGYP